MSQVQRENAGKTGIWNSQVRICRDHHTKDVLVPLPVERVWFGREEGKMFQTIYLMQLLGRFSSKTLRILGLFQLEHVLRVYFYTYADVKVANRRKSWRILLKTHFPSLFGLHIKPHSQLRVVHRNRVLLHFTN